MDESQMRLETQARHKDEERKKARDRRKKVQKTQWGGGSVQIETIKRGVG